MSEQHNCKIYKTDGGDKMVFPAGSTLDCSAATVVGPLTGNDGGATGFAGDNFVESTLGAGVTIGAGASEKFAIHGETPVIQASAMTAQLTTLTHTAPGTPDYAIQDLVDVAGDASQGFAFKTKDEGNSVLKVVANLQVRVAELEAMLNASTGIGVCA